MFGSAEGSSAGERRLADVGHGLAEPVVGAT
jgi:hypothetical protein